MAYAPGFDIVRQYTQGQVFANTAQAFSDPYPFFTIYKGTIDALSQAPMVVLQTSMAFMGIMLIFSFLCDGQHIP